MEVYTDPFTDQTLWGIDFLFISGRRSLFEAEWFEAWVDIDATTGEVLGTGTSSDPEENSGSHVCLSMVAIMMVLCVSSVGVARRIKRKKR